MPTSMFPLDIRGHGLHDLRIPSRGAFVPHKAAGLVELGDVGIGVAIIAVRIGLARSFGALHDDVPLQVEVKAGRTACTTHLDHVSIKVRGNVCCIVVQTAIVDQCPIHTGSLGIHPNGTGKTEHHMKESIDHVACVQ